MLSSHRRTAQRSGHAQCEFTDERFSRYAVPKDFIGRIQDITDYLSHLPETQVNRAYCQKYFGSENGNFMRNKRHVFCVCVFVSEHLWTAKIF